jgi:hypothetical protein
MIRRRSFCVKFGLLYKMVRSNVVGERVSNHIKTMKKLIFAICGVMALAGAISVHAQYSFKFVPTSTDLPPLGDWGGELDMDSPSSVGGNLSDIAESDSWLKTPYGFFTLAQSFNVTSHVPLTWNAAGIETMDITGNVNLGNTPDYSWTITPTYIQIQAPDPQSPMAFGAWEYVPDSASTAWMIGLAAAGLCGIEYLSRNRQMAKARA